MKQSILLDEVQKSPTKNAQIFLLSGNNLRGMEVSLQRPDSNGVAKAAGALAAGFGKKT